MKCKALDLAELIKVKEKEIANVLLSYESYETVRDEIFRSVDCLRNIDIELNDLAAGKVMSICTFFPLNLPLYSLVLFAVILKFMADRVFIRQPERMSGVIQALYQILDVERLFPGISIVDVSRGMFLDGYASVADVIIFTGRHRNASVVQGACPDALFLYNGAGINPIVVSASANLGLAIKKTIEMRVFNSGQDCAGPDAILVDCAIYSTFLSNLQKQLIKVRVGEYRDRRVRVGKLGDYRQIPIISEFLDKYRDHLVYGGVVNFKERVVFPTVVATELEQGIGYQEFFAPIFHVISYEEESDLEGYFGDQQYQDHSMYISLFGKHEYVEKISHSTILRNKIVNDVERGNYPYGGYGRKANYVSYNGVTHYRPVLISKEIAEHLRNS